MGEKREWYALERRAKALPRDYGIVYNGIKQYLWSSSGLLTSGIEMFRGLLELFEEGAANGKPVLEITGNDVAAFCDELMRGEKTYTENWREKLNRDIAKKLGE